MTSLTSALSTLGDDPLGAFPLRPTEIRIGYARGSTGGQRLDRQIGALTLAGRRRVFPEKKSGKNDLRPVLKACHAFLQGGDVLVVPSLDRYGRGLPDLVNMVAALRERQIGFTALHEKLDTTTPAGGTRSAPSRTTGVRATGTSGVGGTDTSASADNERTARAHPRNRG
ncbi:recombinase family protein [Streptomyces pratensis]|uniref:recombinase family protein n=1 Tax=Streptomyces pratensis TaxID=1169025 RepID=UPI00301AF55F